MENREDLLGTLKARLVLAVYDEPRTPSEAAHLLQLPANTVHYWTRKLEGGKLLEVVAQNGRSKTYRALVDASFAEPQSCLPFVRGLLSSLSSVVMKAAEQHDLAATGEQF